MNNIIVGMGEALWDVLPEGKKIGGAPANFAYHVSQFGFDSRVVSAVGRDELGEEILKVFNEKKLKMQIEQVDYPTGTVQVTLDDEGVPCYEIKEGVAWDNIPFTDELKRLALSTRAVCFGSLAQRNEVSRATINRFLDTMPDIDGQLKQSKFELMWYKYDALQKGQYPLADVVIIHFDKDRIQDATMPIIRIKGRLGTHVSILVIMNGTPQEIYSVLKVGAYDYINNIDDIQEYKQKLEDIVLWNRYQRYIDF